MPVKIHSLLVTIAALSQLVLCLEYKQELNKLVYSDKGDAEIAKWIDEWSRSTDINKDKTILDKLNLPPIVYVMSLWSNVIAGSGRATATKLDDKKYELHLFPIPQPDGTEGVEEIIKMMTCWAYCITPKIDEQGNTAAPDGVTQEMRSGIKEGKIDQAAKKYLGLFGFMKIPTAVYAVNRLPDDDAVIGELGRFVEAAYNDQPSAKKRKVVLLSFSAGCLYTFRFLQKTSDEIRGKVQGWFSLGGAFGGDIRMVERVLSSASLADSRALLQKFMAKLGMDDAIRVMPILQSFEQRLALVGFEMPKKKAFGEPIVTIAGTSPEQFSADQLAKLFQTAGIKPNVQKMLLKASEQNNIEEATAKDLLKGIPVYCIYGVDEKTGMQMNYDFKPDGKWNRRSPTHFPGDRYWATNKHASGDGGTSEPSAVLCKDLIKESDKTRRFLVVHDFGAKENLHGNFIASVNTKQIGVYILSSIRQLAKKQQ